MISAGSARGIPRLLSIAGDSYYHHILPDLQIFDNLAAGDINFLIFSGPPIQALVGSVIAIDESYIITGLGVIDALDE
jgi:hypothetical protein